MIDHCAGQRNSIHFAGGYECTLPSSVFLRGVEVHSFPPGLRGVIVLHEVIEVLRITSLTFRDPFSLPPLIAYKDD